MKNFRSQVFNLEFLQRARLLMLPCFVGLVALLCSDFTNAQDKVDFVKEIKPIFEKHCLECHGPEDDGNGFRIDRKNETIEYISEGAADESDIYAYTISEDEDEVMPPPDYEHQMSDESKELIKRWIDEGAEWPDDVKFVKYEEAPKAETNKVGDDDDSSEKSDDEKEEEAPAKLDPKTQTLLNAAGSLHPAAIHLPIGLLLASGFFALFSLRGSFVMSDCAYYCLWLGVLGAIVASATGWFWSPMENKGTVEAFGDIFDSKQPVYWHRIGALGITIAGFVLALFAASARNSDPDEGNMWKFGAILLAVAVAWVGHTGGELHYGESHYKHLNQAWEDLTGGQAAGDAEQEKEPDAKPKDESENKDEEDAKLLKENEDKDDDTSSVGKTSG